MIAEGMGIMIVEDEANKTAGGMLSMIAQSVRTRTMADTKTVIKWMMDWDLMSDSKVYFSLY